MIFLRLLPFFIALITALVFFLQLQHPLQYPWIVIIGVIILPLASVGLAWKKLSFRDLLEKMLPSYILTTSLAFSLLLLEGQFSFLLVIALAAIATFLSLELLFLLVYDPSRYPVNGLSRLTIAYVPIAIWYAAATSSGLMIFLHTDRFWHILLMTLLGAILFRTTGHPGATPSQNAIWMLIGALLGAHVGLLGVMLPLAMPVQGTIAALLLCGPLRVRRYMHSPKPTLRQAWIEGATVVAAFIMTLATAKWL